MSSEFYILSLRWTRENLVTWWCPNNSGYTWLIERAGRYTREQIEGNPGYYNNGETTLAIPCADVEAAASKVVLSEQMEELTGKRFVRVTDHDDVKEDDIPSCDVCGSSPAPTVLGMRVVGKAKP